MARSTLLSSLLTFLLVLLATAATANAAKCPKGAHIIAVRGHPPSGSGGGGSDQGYGITRPLLLALKKAIPHSTSEPIAYPKDAKADQENLIAIKHIKTAIANSVAKCPKTPIVLYGYSNGAFILSNAVCGTNNIFLTSTSPIPKKYAKNVIATILYADGARAPNQPWDKGSCNRGSKFARTNNAECQPFANSMQSYCDAKDGYCCNFGMDHSAHYTYFKDYDTTVSKFAAKRFKAYKKG